LHHKNKVRLFQFFLWLRYAPNRLSAGPSPPDPTGELTALPRPLAGLGGGTPGEREEGRRRKRKGGEGREGVPECPSSEVARLILLDFFI